MQSNVFTVDQIAQLWNVAIYLRVSTSQQERDGTSLETQFEGCATKAELDGETVDAAYVYREQWTGADLDRPQLGLLRQVVRERKIRVLYIFSPDRLARDPLHLLMLMEEFQSAGVEVRFVRGPSDDTPEGRLMIYIQGYFGQKERLEFIERTMRGKRKTAQSGGYPVGAGCGIYGYDYDRYNKVRTVNEQEARVVRMIFGWAFEGWTTYRIALKLNEMNIPTKRGRKWEHTSVKRVLEKEDYTGVTHYGRKRWRKISGKKREVTDMPKSEWIRIEGFTPPLITAEVFEEVQKRLDTPQARAVKSGRRYLLTGFGKCPECGSPIIGSSMRGDRRYYRCRGAWKNPTRAALCRQGYIPAGYLEEVVWGVVSEAARNPAALISDLREHLSTGDGDLGARMEEMRREIADLKLQQRRLMELLQKDEKGEIDVEILMTQLGPLKALCDEKESSLRVLEEQRKQNDDADEAAERVARYCQALSDKLDDLDFEGKRATLAAFGVRFEATRKTLSITVTVDPNCTTIAHTLGSSPNRQYTFKVARFRRGRKSEPYWVRVV